MSSRYVNGQVATSMRIGMLAQLLSFNEGYRQAGVSRYIEHLLRFLPGELDSGDELLVYAGDAARVSERIDELPASLQWNWTNWPTGKVPVRILWEQLAFPVLARSHKADLIHGPVNVVPVASGKPSIVTIHDLAFLQYPEQYPGFQRRYLTRMTRASTHRADRVIAVSEFTGRDVAERLGVPESKIVAVPNGVSGDFFPRQGTKELDSFRREKDLPDEFLLFTGTLQPRKNVIGLLRAYSLLDRSDRLPLYIVGGTGWMFSTIFDEVKQLGIEADVHFAGYAASESLPLWYSAATAFIYPSFYEGFGLPVLEAMACGTPVITSNRTSLPEVVGDAGLLVDPDDPDDIAAAMRALLADSDYRTALGETGRMRAQGYSWKRTARETAAVYRQVLSAY
ncbi:MAG: glycosyltransferase family 1 protein [Thermomicrobiaceae bacterium]